MKRSKDKVEFFGCEGFQLSDKIKHTEKKYMSYYKDIRKIRLMEQYLDTAYDKNKVRGFCHLVIGQEGLYAVLKGILENNKNHKLICSYRCHGAAYAAGCTIKEIVAEALGLLDGNCKGKGGSMHLYNHRFFGGHGIVGAQVPLANGIAYSIKYKSFVESLQANKALDGAGNIKNSEIKDFFIRHSSNAVCFCIYGDGASNQGQVFESFNMAKIYNLPVVYIVENNQYGMYTPIQNVSVDDCFFKRGYKIPGIRISDTDLANIEATMKYAVEFSLDNGPIIVQVDTYRICGHSSSDKTQFYKEAREKAEEVNLDCFENLKNILMEKFSEADFCKINKSIDNEFETEISSINFQSFPKKSDLFTDLFFD